MCFFVKRIYQQPDPADGYRLLVDRIWPRGISWQAAMIDEWMKDIGPSTELRQWFNHDASRWTEFRSRYHVELENRSGLVNAIMLQSGTGPVTLLYSARDTAHNQAVALAEYLTIMKPLLAINVSCQRSNCAACIER